MSKEATATRTRRQPRTDDPLELGYALKDRLDQLEAELADTRRRLEAEANARRDDVAALRVELKRVEEAMREQASAWQQAAEAARSVG